MIVLALSDVPLGFGSPQVERIAHAVGRFYNAAVHIVTPAGEDARPDGGPNDATLHRIETADPLTHHAGEAEFAIQAARTIDHVRPDILILFAFLGAPALVLARHRPRRCMYVGYEHTDGVMARMETVFSALEGRFDFAVFPDPFRAALDAPRLKLHMTPSVVLYNGAPSAPEGSLPVAARSGRLFYGGLIDGERTYGDALLHGVLSDLPIDAYGRLHRVAPPREGAGVRYFGLAPRGPDLRAHLRSAVGALVMWRPLTESTRYAAPNKFFEAIAEGVPPITTPHPQTAAFVERFGCGVVAKDFTPAALRNAAESLLAMVGTSAYEALVVQGLVAAQHSVGWDAQARKLDRALAQFAMQ